MQYVLGVTCDGFVWSIGDVVSPKITAKPHRHRLRRYHD